MMQLAVWGGLAQDGLGASLQHYSELIEGDVKQKFDIPENWKLMAQMPFGNPVGKNSAKTYLPLENRLIVKN
jgi:predicted oxidoreductase (fatty acid repression mutant protein)